MTLHIRRVVTGHDADGKAVIIADGEAPRSWRRPSGLGQSLCWVTDTMPVDNAGHADGGDQDIGIPPPPHGSVFRIVEFPPEGDDLDHADPSRASDAQSRWRHRQRRRRVDGSTPRHAQNQHHRLCRYSQR